MSMTIQSYVKDKILATPSETSKIENAPAEMLPDGQSERMSQTLEDIMRACVIDFGSSYHLSIWCAPFEALYGRKCRSLVLWVEIGESSLSGLGLVQETTDKLYAANIDGKGDVMLKFTYEKEDKLTNALYVLKIRRNLVSEWLLVDYAGAIQDRKSTTGGCQFLGNRLISWQCKKQTVVATSTTEAEYVAAANCCGQRKQLQYNHLRTYHVVPSLSHKVFNNMKRPTKGYSGQEVALFPTMLDVTEPSTSPSRITSSPSPSPKPSPSHLPEPSTQHSPDNTTAAPTQPSPTQPSPRAEHLFPTPHDSPLHAVHSHGSDEGSLKLNELTNLVTKLSDRIGVLEDDLRKTKKTYSSPFTKLILRVKKLEARGRKLSDAEVQEKASTETEPFIQEVTPTEVIQDQGSNEKRSAEVSTAGATKGTASEVPVVSTAEENLSTAGRTVTYTRRSEEKRTRQDKGKAIMIESKPKKNSKKELEQERLTFAEAIRLEE
ncbi:ribonuclease H-like domain, reverse transcriptase, RNA-dependent DNA polymerase [Tanacetum coccineum]